MKTFIDFQKEEVELDEVATPIKNKVQDRKTGKWYDPTKEFNKLMDKPEVKAQMKRMAKTDVKEEAELDVESIDEGRPSQQHPLEGHDYHRKTNAELEYIAKDAHKAAEAMKSHNTTAENKYRDQASDSATVRHFRKTSGTPDWYKKKYGHVKEEAELEEEQLDELSKDTLASYEKKSRVAAHKHALASELKGLAADPAGSYAHKMMADKRHAGWKVAVKKLHTEESDTPFEGPYKQSKGTVTDKSGAKHTPLSNVRSLARNAIEKMKQKMRMAHLSPEVKAEKLARNEELVGGQKKLDIDKDGKIIKAPQIGH